MKSETTFIYALADPETGETRYVGKADAPTERHYQHCWRANKTATHKNCWILGLRNRGLRPQVKPLIEVLKSEWEQWERAIIKAFRILKVPLTNLTEGGDSGPNNVGRKHPPEFGAKIRARLVGKKKTPAHCAALGASRRGKKLSAEHRVKLSEAHIGEKNHFFGKRHSPETIAKMTGKKRTPEHCAALSAAFAGEKHPLFGTKQSPETIAKKVAKLSGQKRTPEQRARISAGTKAAMRCLADKKESGQK